ncbi:MAG: DUF1801 domain-containing protein [Bryobacteraceae bacterium]
MRKRLPGAVELVYDNYNALAIGFGPSEKASEAIFSIAVFPRWVSLFFLQGATLEDPENLLKGSGRRARHIVLKDAGTLDEPAIEALMAQALKTAESVATVVLPAHLLDRFLRKVQVAGGQLFGGQTLAG